MDRERMQKKKKRTGERTIEIPRCAHKEIEDLRKELEEHSEESRKEARQVRIHGTSLNNAALNRK